MSECNCRSYNLQIGQREEMALAPPHWLQAMRDHDRPERPVMVDACIAEAVKALWDAGHVTLGSCCGHGGKVNPRPSLVLGNDEEDFAAIRAVLATVDDREWELLQWRIIEVGKGGDSG